MAKARLYSLDTDAIDAGKAKKYVAGLKGQAKIVYDELKANKEPRLAVDIEKACAAKIVTRQDTLRVVLYYIIVFKGKGLVKATEPVDDDVDVPEELEQAESTEQA